MADDVRGVFARNLTRYIAQSGRSQKEIADTLGVAQSTFNNWCTGVRFPRVDKVEQLARYFGIKESDLIEGRTTEAIEKDADILADVFVRMRADVEFCELVKQLHAYDAVKIKGFNRLLHTLNEQAANKFEQCDVTALLQQFGDLLKNFFS